jgi:hypothetical protein
MRLADIVDTNRYLEGERRKVALDRCRRAMADFGSATLEGFVLPDALAEMVREANAVFSHAYRRDNGYTAYMADEAVGDETHPTRRLHRYALDAIANDRLNPTGAMSVLYRDQTFVSFIADVLQQRELYPLGDPLLGLTLTYLSDGDEHGWHFDRNDFVVSLLLQSAEQGGTFEFAPFIRSETEPNFDAVAALMDGSTAGLQRIRATAGTLAIFAGKRSLHRVSPVSGGTRRIIALLSYDREPNLVHEKAVHMRTFGRTTAAV